MKFAKLLILVFALFSLWATTADAKGELPTGMKLTSRLLLLAGLTFWLDIWCFRR